MFAQTFNPTLFHGAKRYSLLRTLDQRQHVELSVPSNGFSIYFQNYVSLMNLPSSVPQSFLSNFTNADEFAIFCTTNDV